MPGTFFGESKSCRVEMNCPRRDCPAWNNKESPCWQIPGTLCREHSGHPRPNRLQQCMDCPVFRKQGEMDPLGWVDFLHGKIGRVFAALDHLPDGILIAGSDGRVEYLNKAAEKIPVLGSTLPGMNLSDVLESLQAPGHLIRSPAGSGPHEFTLRGSDTTQAPVEYRTTLIGNPAGGTVLLLEEISREKALEEKLRLSRTRYRRLFEGSKDMIFITSHEGKIREVNQACLDILGYGSRDELLSLPGIEEIYDNPLHWRVFQRQIHLHGFVKDFDSSFRKKDGSRLHCLLSGNAVRDEAGRIVGYEGIAKDITARMDALRNLRQRHLEMRVLNSLALALNKPQDLNTTLGSALGKVLKALSLSSGAIFLIEGPERAFSMRAQQGLYQETPEGFPQVEFFDKILMKALLDDNLCLKPEPIFPPFKVGLRLDADREQELTCFLITAKDKSSGFMAFAVPPHRDITTGQDFHLLGSVANFLGGAIQNASLLETVRKHRKELQDLTGKLYQTLDFERKRIAQDLHDETGQSLTGILLTLEALEKELSPAQPHAVKAVEEAKSRIDRAHQEIRRISYRLHPALLSELGLRPALEAFFRDISKRTALSVECSVVGFEERVNPEIEIALYRITQEALSNAIRHSGARQFTLSIVKSYPRIIFQAQDDGIGMNPDRLASQEHALGIVGMRERVHMLKGRFKITFSRGKGTRIRAEIPF